MRISVNVRIDNEQGDTQYGMSMGAMSFTEDATFSGAGFETVANVFLKIHELLDTLKREHKPERFRK